MIKKAYVDTRDGQIHYRYSNEGSGAPLVFFHMTAASSEAYQSVMEELEGRFPLIAFDTVNYGESYRTTREPSIGYIADVKLEALANMGIESFHTFGHHTGVPIQIEMAVKAPHRVLSAIASGVAYVSLEAKASFSDKLSISNPISIKGTQFMFAWSRIKDNMQLLSTAQEPPHAAEIMHRDTVDMLRAGEYWHWGYRAGFSYDLMAAMKVVKCPMFFICGGKDLSYPLHDLAVKEFKHAKSYVNAEGGVYYIETHPQEVAREVSEFITGLP